MSTGLRRLGAGFILTGLVASVFLPRWPGPRTAEAGSVSTSSWGCGWTGDTWFNSTTGYGATSGNPSCAVDSMLRLQYYNGSSWQDLGYQYSGTYWIQLSAAPAYSLSALHQIKHNVNGWGQVEGTSE